jgi:lipoprotein-releasing system ATP-binding protein
MQPAPEPILCCEDLQKSYLSAGRDLPIFSGLNLRIDAGERVAIVGESGSGKSTLLHLLGGLDRPTGGRILYKGQDIAAMSDAALADYRNRQIGFVWQIHYLLPEFTALENVMMPLLIRGDARAAAAARAHEMLDDVGLSARATHRAGELSGGEQQRVVLARALAGRPALLLADEPTGNLDSRTGERIIELIAGMHQKHNLTSVLVTHNLAFAAMCDRILRLENGELIPAAP